MPDPHYEGRRVLSGAILDPATNECYITRVSYHRSWGRRCEGEAGEEAKGWTMVTPSQGKLDAAIESARNTTFSVCKLGIRSWGNLLD